MKIIPAAFEGRDIRRVYDEKTETWLFCVVDIIKVLTEQPDFQTARKYWNKLKERLSKEGKSRSPKPTTPPACPPTSPRPTVGMLRWLLPARAATVAARYLGVVTALV